MFKFICRRLNTSVTLLFRLAESRFNVLSLTTRVREPTAQTFTFEKRCRPRTVHTPARAKRTLFASWSRRNFILWKNGETALSSLRRSNRTGNPARSHLEFPSATDRRALSRSSDEPNDNSPRSSKSPRRSWNTEHRLFSRRQRLPRRCLLGNRPKRRSAFALGANLPTI